MDRILKFFKTPLGLAAVGSGCIILLGAVLQFQADELSSELVDVKVPISPRSQTVEVGGVVRPRSDVQGSATQSRKAVQIESEGERTYTVAIGEEGKVETPYGEAPRHAKDKNATIQAVYNATKSNDPKSQESYSAFAEIESFNQDSFNKNPDAYISQVVPARVWQSAQPGKGVPQLRRVGGQQVKMIQGEAVALKVKTAPGAPVSLMSFDHGAFQNDLVAITVRADQDGTATANFTATPGAIGHAQIIAASPLASGNVEFTVNIVPQFSR